MSGLWTWDPGTDRVSWSGSLAPLLGVPAAATTYAEHLAAVYPGDRDEVDRAWRAVARDGGEDRQVFRGLDGAMLSALVQRVDQGDHPVVVGSIVQVTRAKKDELRFVDLFHQFPVGMAVLSDEGRFLEVNDALCQLLARNRSDLLTLRYADVVHPDDRSAPDGVEEMLREELPVVRTESLLLRGDGSAFWGRVATSRFGSGVSAYWVCSIEDITASKAAQQQLLDLALHDPLTGLPNRRLLLDRLETALARSRRAARDVAVLFLDVDHLKRVNDALGHEAGDELLLAVARNLSSAVRASDTVARLGGDEFVVVCEDVPGRDQLDALVVRVLDAVRLPVGVGGEQVVVTASIGVAVASSPDDHPQDLLRAADAAMYRAKRDGRARWTLAQPGEEAQPVDRLAMESGLRRAIDSGQLVLHYQPVVRLDGTVVALEALLRWQHPERGLLLPEDFLEAAQPHVGRTVTAWVLGEAARDAVRWIERGAGTVAVSVNVPVDELRAPGFADDVATLLASTGLPAAALNLELSEHQLAEVDTVAVEAERLHQLGVGLAVDDFGTGYSSLAYLRRLPLDTVKIGGSFVATICDDEEDAAIVRAVLDACRATHRTSVAEGVETVEQLHLLAELGCDALQGSLLSPPQPFPELAGLLAVGRIDLDQITAQA